MLALWLSGYLVLVPAMDAIEPIRLAFFSLFLSLALLSARRIAVVVLFLAVLVALATTGRGGGPSMLIKGAEFSIIFSVFLPVLVLVRETMNRAEETKAAQEAFTKLEDSDRIAGLTGAVHFLGAFLILGGLFMTGPFVAAQEDHARRRKEALAAMRGFGSSIFWSPFTIGMAFALTNRPAVQLWQAMTLGLILAASALAISLIVFTKGAAIRGLFRAIRALRPVAVVALVSMAAVVIVSSLTPFGTVATVGLVMPLLCFLRLSQIGTNHILDGTRQSVMRLDRLGDEFLLFTAAAIFGFTLQSTGAAGLLASSLALDRLPALALPLAIILIGTLLAFTGVHSVVIGGLVVALLQPLDARLPDIVEVALILIPWGIGGMISYSSLSIVTAVSVYRLGFKDLVWSVNLLFLLMMSVIWTLIFLPIIATTATP